MEKLIKHLAPIRRSLPERLPIRACGLIGKTPAQRLDRTFSTFNFSFILEGSGDYSIGHQSFRVSAPCVFVQPPETPVSYGPSAYWRELYLIYDSARLHQLRSLGYADPDRPLWKAQQNDLLLAFAEHARSLLLNWTDDLVDSFDRLAEMLIVASLANNPRDASLACQDKLAQARQWLDQNFAKPETIDQLARRFGFSPVTFRRHWTQRFGLSPGKHRSRIRLQRACQLLVESDLPVGEISRRVGFDDPLYFSRRFKEMQRTTPRAYRLENQQPLANG